MEMISDIGYDNRKIFHSHVIFCDR